MSGFDTILLGFHIFASPRHSGRFLSLSKDDRRISFLQGGAVRAAAVILIES